MTDGDLENESENARAIIEASNYPLSIITIGLGDHNFAMMERFDDELPQRKFDNFQFVPFNKVISSRVENVEIEFAVTALQEIPDQYQCIKNLKLIEKLK